VVRLQLERTRWGSKGLDRRSNGTEQTKKAEREVRSNRVIYDFFFWLQASHLRLLTYEVIIEPAGGSVVNVNDSFLTAAAV
jgi:hypothetical protein